MNITLILIAVAVIGVVLLIIGSMTDRGLISTIGLICTVLGLLILFLLFMLRFVAMTNA